jgi:hypothetical protein
MAKEKIDIVINGMTFKGIQAANWGGRYNIDTAGIAQIIRQYVKNKYGDIKVWARSRSFAGGSAVDVNFWAIPDEWYRDIESFADSFGKYNEYDGGDGVWRGKNVNAVTTDGKIVGNYSPYIHVSNTPPWDAKERDMTPPDYSKSLPKKSSGSKGYKKFGEKKTDGFIFSESCLNGWKLFSKYADNMPKPYHYRLVKDYEVKPVGKEQFYALKGDMLEVGFAWSVKAQCFEMFSRTAISGETFSNACAVLRKYFPMTEEPKKEEETLPTQTEEVNLEQLLNDMAILLDLEEDAVKRAELEQYISDLQILASLNN